jgi:hypothetical protein
VEGVADRGAQADLDPVGEAWVPADRVRDHAAGVGLRPRMLRRLSAEGLMAQPRQRGLGYGRGTVVEYPDRAFTQLEAVAGARPHRISPILLRHRVWWRSGGSLEEWPRWRDDRVRDLRNSAPAWDLAPAIDDVPEEREQAVIELVDSWEQGRGPLPGGIGTLRSRADRETAVSLFYSVVLRDGLLVDLAGAHDPEEARARLRAILAQPVDGEPGEPGGQTLGELFERALGKPKARKLPGAPGEMAVGLFGFMPDPQDVPARIATLDEPRARELRDGLLAWSTRSQGTYAAQLYTDPALAGLMLLWWETTTASVPAVLEAIRS